MLAECFLGAVTNMLGPRLDAQRQPLNAGAFEVPENCGPAEVEVSPSDTALVTFFLILVRRLQCLGTVPAIDWPKYEAIFRA